MQLWIVKYPHYKQLIEQAETIEEVQAIEIVYTSEIPQEEVENDI